MAKPNIVIISTFAASIAALALSASALYMTALSGTSVETDSARVDQLASDVARIKPWAYSRTELSSAVGQLGQVPVPALDPTQAPANVVSEVRDDMVRRYGDASAQFTLTEYSDFECSFCKDFFQVPKALVDGSRGNISVVFKHVAVHGEASRKEAFAAECAADQGGNDAFYRMADAIFANTRGDGNGTKFPLSAIADQIGLNGRALSRCMDQGRYFEKVKADFLEAVSLGVKVTPTTVVRHNPTGRQTTLVGAKAPAELLQAMSDLASGATK